MKHRRPKRLNLDLACYYQLPDDLTTAELNQYEVYYRQNYPAFVLRVGSRLYFQFESAQERDIHLLTKEITCRQQGILTDRETVTLDTPRTDLYLADPTSGWQGSLQELSEKASKKLTFNPLFPSPL